MQHVNKISCRYSDRVVTFFSIASKINIRMPNYRFCVGVCDNNSRFPDKTIKRRLIAKLKFHYFPKDDAKRQLWKNQLTKG